ncbi:ABC-type dipeptide-binding protein, solute binding protein [Candidatus Phytoplasma pruni]|uniref:ABC-type dipeptide-binding protein, solute binding protein n=1 Tax=Candidatus Phytoplasma pruni TaxID=479893 RepID=A0A0M1N0G4_9MOLU|nr:ABC transporter substrate-binding protein [Candidatus Phytoplasma pruni]KOR75525.1 ABC-type dipeptide-binding protein, solute binding protein [Candidatus Phytoplasma pruni]
MSKIKNSKKLVIIVSSVLLVCGTLYFYKRGKETDKAAKETVKTVNMVWAADIKGFDPTNKIHSSSSVSAKLYSAVHDTLIVEDKVNEKTVGRLAEKWVKVGNEITFTLRDDIFFHNGQPVTTEDVVYSLQKGINNNNNDYSDIIQDLNVLDDKKVKVTIKNDILWWTSFLASYRILCKSEVEADNDKGVKVGAGPYKLVHYERDDKMSFELFENYWNKEAIKESPKKLMVKIQKSFETTLQELETGTIDLATEVPSDKVNSLKEKISNGTLKGLEIVENTNASVLQIYMNAARTKKPARQAISLALNFPPMISALQLPVTPLDTYVPSCLVGHNKQIKRKYDMDEAKIIVSGLSTEDKKIKLGYAGKESPQLPNKIAESLREAGFDVTTETADFNAFLSEVKEPTSSYNMVLMGELHEMSYGHKALCDYFLKDSVYALPHIQQGDATDKAKGEVIDSKLRQTQKESNLKTYTTLVKEVQQILNDEVYVIPIYEGKLHFLKSSKIKDFTCDIFSRIDWEKIKKLA